jgi:hypothetical protein
MKSRDGAEAELGKLMDDASVVAAITRFSLEVSESGGRQFATEVGRAISERL